MSFEQELDMMAQDVKSQLATASLTFTKKARGTFNAATGARPGTTVVTSTILAQRGPVSIAFTGAANTKVAQVVWTALASQFATRPEGDDTLQDGTTVWKVIEVADSVDLMFLQITTERKV